MGFAGPHAPYYRCPSAVTLQQLLASVSASWVGWWTTYDPTLQTAPGVALSAGTVVSWADMRAGYAIAPVAVGNQPPLAVDGAFCHGIPGIQCAITGPKHLAGGANFAGNLLLSGTSPYYVYVMRSRTAPVATERMTECSNGGTSVNVLAQFQTDGSIIGAAASGTPVASAASFLDRNPHVLEIWAPAAGPSLRLDGGTQVQNLIGSTSISANVTRLSLGGGRAGGGNYGDTTFWELFVFTSYIGDALALQLVAALRRKWGI